MSKSPRVAVVGAGCSGLTSIKNLVQAGVQEVVCFEQNDQVGGNWAFTGSVGHSSVCETTHIISSKRMSEFEDFPMPADYPDYPSHAQVLAYFQSYADHFNLKKHIRFNTKIIHITKLDTEGKDAWDIELENGEHEVFDYVMLANGHHSVPRMPEFEGSFSGEFLHSHSYKSSQPFAGKRVLVVGAGNSGCDCAVEISRVASHVGISMRSPQYIFPKFFSGVPTDVFAKQTAWMPQFLREPLQRLSLRFIQGKYSDYGLEAPNYSLTKSHPTVNSELLYRIRHGKVHPRKGIKWLEGDKVHFTDGTVETYDVILAATGYKITFPFFDKSFVDYEEADEIPLWLRVFHPEHRSLFFIGLVQPQGCIWPLSDAQAKLTANLIMGRWQLPENLEALAQKDAENISKNFVEGKRHSVEVHFAPYLKSLKRQL